MKSLYLYIIMIFFKFIPESRFFKFKNILLRLSGIKIGSETRICSSVIFHTANVVIGNGVWIGPGCRFLAAEHSMIIIEDNVDIAMENLFVTGSHEVGGDSRRAGKAIRNNIIIEKGVWCGTRCVFMGGTYVSKGSIVAAMSFCSTKYQENSLITGQPAKVKKAINNV